MSLLGDAKHAPWAENGIGSTLPICNGLEVVIILLMTAEDFAISNLIKSEIGYDQQLDSCRTKKGEVLDYEGNGIGTQPERVLDATTQFFETRYSNRGRPSHRGSWYDCRLRLLLSVRQSPSSWGHGSFPDSWGHVCICGLRPS